MKSSERIYLDLMAGEPENIGKGQDKKFDGSPRIAMKSHPEFTQLVFCERDPRKVKDLVADLVSNFPEDKRWKVMEGDCNEEIDGILSSLSKIAWAPTFAFIDQQAAEITWETLSKVAHFRKNKRNLKTELWILLSPAMIIKGVTGTNSDAFTNRVDLLYGNESWKRVLAARLEKISAEDFRVEMVNLFRWNLQTVLGYTLTARIPMKMTNSTTLYDMVFATDHPLGQEIMTGLYRSAAEREPEMNREARARAVNSRASGYMQDVLFPVEAEHLVPTSFPKWEHYECWDPSERTWW
jgi:three-Cys-motif partner protein